MADRIDEAQGRVKQGIGTAIGDEDMAREGETQGDIAKMKREAEGAIDKGVGRAQEVAGDILDDEDMEARGKARQLEGDLERAG